MPPPAATKDYRGQSDTVTGFFDGCNLITDSALQIEASELLALHGEWFEIAGITEAERAHYQRVVEELKARGVVQVRRGKARTRTWIGVGEQGGDQR